MADTNIKLGTIEVEKLVNGCYQINDEDKMGLMQNNTHLQSVNCDFPELIDGTQMFYGCSNLSTVDISLNKLETAFRMFQGCSTLTKIEGETQVLTDGRHMFRDCTSLSENDILIENLQNNVVDGMAMFQNTSFSCIPWTFPNLKRCKQLFDSTKISGHLSLNMGELFPQVTAQNFYNSKGELNPDVASYMFANCNITSLDFDVSNLSCANSMFHSCFNLTTCTGAKFKQGCDYQSMFPHSVFDETSAGLIYEKAMEAQVTALHIGVGFQITETHPFAIKYNLSMLDDDQSGRQWRNTECNVVFVCNTPENQNVSIINIDDYPPIID